MEEEEWISLVLRDRESNVQNVRDENLIEVEEERLWKCEKREKEWKSTDEEGKSGHELLIGKVFGDEFVISNNFVDHFDVFGVV